ncbi:MAG: SDR family oxidoreductase [Candidatus Atribacteria bacterium]|jgi:NAD(P)-dependent dehydrogenase (short-subunit alcohol dehydrogenase family)|nr:SDR family oxidoreductase [Candidatus Atribacteria bacterium]
MNPSEMFDLSGKIALVTGGGSGLGQSNAVALAKAGASIMLADIDFEKAEDTRKIISKFSNRVDCFKCDVRSAIEVNNLVEKTIQEFGKIDILLNSAGIMPKQEPILEMSEDNWNRVIDVNLKGTFLTCQAVLKKMIPQKKGRIINMASASGLVVNYKSSHVAPYCASKAGVILLTKALAVEVAPYGITVNAISPAYMKTQMTALKWEKDKNDYLKKVSMLPVGRIGIPEELSGLVIYLASDCSAFMTGSNVVIDGGLTCW